MGDVIPFRGSEYSGHSTGTIENEADALELAYRIKSVEDEQAALTAALIVLNNIYQTGDSAQPLHDALAEREAKLRQKWEQEHGVDSIQILCEYDLDFFDPAGYDWEEVEIETSQQFIDHLEGDVELEAIEAAGALNIEGLDHSQPLTAEVLELVTDAINRRILEITHELERVYAGGYTDSELAIIEQRKQASKNKEMYLRITAERLMSQARGLITEADMEERLRKDGFYDNLPPSHLNSNL